MHAVRGLGDEKPTAPYDLSLAFTELAATPHLVTVAADGSSYTGGAHGNPLLARFTWLPDRKEQLTATKLIPDPDAVIKRFGPEFDKLLYLALMGDWSREMDSVAAEALLAT